MGGAQEQWARRRRRRSPARMLAAFLAAACIAATRGEAPPAAPPDLPAEGVQTLHLPDGEAYRSTAPPVKPPPDAPPPRIIIAPEIDRVPPQHPLDAAAADPPTIGTREHASASWDGPAFILFGFLEVPPWVVGVCCGITGYTLCGLGMNLIRLSHIVTGSAGSTAAPSASGGAHLRETPFNRKSSQSRASLLWVLGYFFNSLGGSLNIAGLRFAAQSLMAPLSSIALIANAFFATILCGERLSMSRDAGPMLLIAVGNALTVASANHKGFKDLSVDEFARFFLRPTFQRYLAVVVVAVIALSAMRLRLKNLIKRSGGREYANQTLVARMGLCHAAAGCMLCVHGALFSKGSMLILAQGLEHALQPTFSLIIMAWVSLVGLWVYTLNRLLKEYDALFIIPVIEVVWSLQSMISGGIFFDEYSALSMSRLCLFATGVVVNVTGVLVLSHRGEKKKLSE